MKESARNNPIYFPLAIKKRALSTPGVETIFFFQKMGVANENGLRTTAVIYQNKYNEFYNYNFFYN
jgi:hypothetical protein